MRKSAKPQAALEFRLNEEMDRNARLRRDLRKARAQVRAWRPVIAAVAHAEMLSGSRDVRIKVLRSDEWGWKIVVSPGWVAFEQAVRRVLGAYRTYRRKGLRP